MKTFLKSRWVIGALVVIALGAGYWFFLRSRSAPYQFITVTRGTIAETVSVTGNTTPTKSVSLGFQNTGTIARVSYNLGDHVSAGAVIAELSTGNLSAALQQAKANLAVAEANLAALTAGTRPEQLAIDQNSVAQDQVALANAIASAYAASDSAVHTNADQFFTNPRTAGAALTFIVPDATLTNKVVQERVALEPVLAAWGAQVSSASFGSGDPLVAEAQAVQDLSQVSAFLNDAAAALAKTSPSGNLSAATLTTYESSIATARTSIAGVLTTLASAKTALIGAEGTLALAQAGSTPESIAAQQAQVQQAQAGVASAVANLQGSQIIAPMSGVVTQQDAKVGQLASPGTPLVSIIGIGGFEVDAGVSETDVGKVMVGDAATMTLDAFPNETFAGSVFYIAPAQTNTQGVISYEIKISFAKADPRLKSGLTANIDIQTKKKENVLILPQYAILQNDSGTFVETLAGTGTVTTTTPVTLGIQDQKGNVEVLSGVTLGEQVINIGLKAQ
ncbi:MAG: efflux RND transporter periplasmic adaptor subunit [Minisyncoccota bacterium]